MEIDDLVRLISETAERLERMEERQLDILEAVQPQSWTIDDVCRVWLHHSRTWATERPWTLPNYGVPDVPGKPHVWFTHTVREYYAVPLSVRKAQYFRQLRKKSA